MKTWEVAKAGDGATYAATWDANTMIKDLLADADLQKLSKSEKTMLAMGLGMGIRMGFSQDMTIFDYERMEVRKVEVDGDRAVAVIRGWDIDDFGLSWRIWLAQRDGEWRIHDAEEMSQGIRISRLMLAALSGDIASGEVPPWVRSMDSLLAAANGAKQVGFAVIATTAVILAVFSPVLFLQDAADNESTRRKALQVAGDAVDRQPGIE